MQQSSSTTFENGEQVTRTVTTRTVRHSDGRVETSTSEDVVRGNQPPQHFQQAGQVQLHHGGGAGGAGQGHGYVIAGPGFAASASSGPGWQAQQQQQSTSFAGPGFAGAGSAGSFSSSSSSGSHQR